MSILSTVIRFAAPLPKITEAERFLFIGPHPDDIEIGAGATAARLAAEGKQVCFLICIDGRYGTDELGENLSPETLAQRRREEAVASARLLGVTDVRFLSLCDGGFYPREELLRGIAGVIGDFQPELIFAPDPDVDSECHPDHRNVGEAARELALFAENPGIMARYGTKPAPVRALALYMTAAANQFVDTGGFLNRQLSAVFDGHKTQFPDGCDSAKAIRLYLRLRAVDFGLRSFHRTAEGFRVLGKTQMHCLPEAGTRR